MSGTRGEGARSVDRQITIQDVECLREAFSLFDPNRKDVITPEELGKVKKQVEQTVRMMLMEGEGTEIHKQTHLLICLKFS